MKPRLLLAISTLVFLAPFSLARAHGAYAPESPATGITSLVSVASDGTQANDWSGTPTISADGRFVTFCSRADNLVPGDTNGSYDIFVHDRQTGDTTRVSVASDGTQGNGMSQYPSISADGRTVAFQSEASNLVLGDTNGKGDIFVHDTQTGQTSRVSVASDGTQGNQSFQDAYSSAISPDGRYVAFNSVASNLVPGDTNEFMDIFVHDRLTGQTSRVNLASDGTQANWPSSRSAVSLGGRYVAFLSSASNLIPDGQYGGQVYVHDRQTGQTTRVSVASDGTPGNLSSSNPAISANGDYVAFYSPASNLVTDDTNDTGDVFVHHRSTGQTIRVSVASDGAQANDSSFGFVSISADGLRVAFRSGATNLVPGDTNGKGDVFVHDTQTGQTSRVSVASDGTQADWSSGDWGFAISGDGRYVTFDSMAYNLVPNDSTFAADVYVRDREGEAALTNQLFVPLVLR